MSVQAISWVLDHSISKSTARLVMVAIGNEADRLGIAHPGVRTIADAAGIDRATVLRTVPDLEVTHELIVGRPQQYGRGRHNVYLLRMGRTDEEIEALEEWTALLAEKGCTVRPISDSEKVAADATESEPEKVAEKVASDGEKVAPMRPDPVSDPTDPLLPETSSQVEPSLREEEEQQDPEIEKLTRCAEAMKRGDRFTPEIIDEAAERISPAVYAGEARSVANLLRHVCEEVEGEHAATRAREAQAERDEQRRREEEHRARVCPHGIEREQRYRPPPSCEPCVAAEREGRDQFRRALSGSEAPS